MKRVNKKWVATLMNVRGIQHTLEASLGFGLAVYMPAVRFTLRDIMAAAPHELALEKLLQPLSAASRPVLSLCLDGVVAADHFCNRP